MPGKKPSARKPSGSKARGANPREDAKPRRVPPSPIVFEQPGTLSFAIIRAARQAREAASRNARS
jgi:hypothetical protein